MRSSRSPPLQSHLIEQCQGSVLDTTTNLKGNFSLPQGSLQQSMNKYQRDAREKLNLSMVIDQVSTAIHEIIDKLIHDKIYSEVSRVINEVLCIRQQVTLFSKQGTQKQEEINESFAIQIKKMKRRLDQITSKTHSLNFQSYISQHHTSKSRISPQSKMGEGIEGIIKDVYQFMRQNEATKLFNQCQAKLERFQQSMKQSKYQHYLYSQSLMQKLEEMKRKQKPINQNLRQQLNDALSKDVIGKEIKKSLKQNIRYLFDQLVRSRKDIDELKDEMKKLCERQREIQFSQTLLEHKIA